MLSNVIGTAPFATPWPVAAFNSVDADLVGEPTSFCFGRFRALTGARALLRDGHRVEIGGRAFDILVRLLRSRGEIVPKSDIIAHVWPGIFVEESNLRFQMAQLRKILGEDGDLIKTVPGRGYLLVEADSTGPETSASHARSSGVSAPSWARTEMRRHYPHPRSPGLACGQQRAHRVAVIDSDEEAAGKLAGLLKQYNMEVQQFRSAETFLAGRAAQEVDCVILDVWLPGKNGLELQAEIVGAGLLVPFIFVTSHADVEIAVKAMKAGASEFFPKPLRHLELVEAVRGALGLNVVREVQIAA